MVAKEIVGRPDIGLRPVAFVDDDPMQQGTVLHGIVVAGTTESIPEVARKVGAKQALITIAGASGATIRRVTELCKLAGIPAKIIPGLYEVVGGQFNLSRIRDVAIEDLLRRAPIELEDKAIAEYVRDRVVFVTGAGGSIGSELCRQICGYGPRRLVLIERAENNLFSVHQELIARYPELGIVPLIADVCDEPRLRVLFREHNPQVVLHAAAHKHVPMMEWNPSEAVKNNVGGTVLMADLAVRFQVERFVLVSTDKAVNPSSVMGAAKRLAEQYIQSLSENTQTRFVAVRFGNVLGSAGSVVPIFKEQIAKGGPVTVTHPEMRRYFMTIPEACQLVLQAASMGRGGEIFILDMGEPVLIADLAKDLIRLSGLQPDVDIELAFTGLRPGEKLFEELSIKDEVAEKTTHPKIFVGKLRTPTNNVRPGIDELLAMADVVPGAQIRSKLCELVPEYTPDLSYEDSRATPPSSDAPLSRFGLPRNTGVP
jgi:FlaA1/EpsC-like NDP-sugar epimerase